MIEKVKVVVVGSGEDYSPQKLRDYCRGASYVIASDGGYDSLKSCGITPHYLIGDLDSIRSEQVEPGVKIERYNPEKDYSDSELGILKAEELGAEEIFLFGLTGSYFDHSFANVINLFKYCKNSVNIEIITANSCIFSIFNRREFLGVAGRRCSLFPLTEIRGLIMEGFKYRFDKDSLSLTDYSLSNVIDDERAVVQFSEGLMFGLLFDEDYR